MFKAHITIEPILDEAELYRLRSLAASCMFQVADLLMVKRPEDTPERSKYDTFLTGHSYNYMAMAAHTITMVNDLKRAGFKVWRYKIEEIVVDSREKDLFNLL